MKALKIILLALTVILLLLIVIIRLRYGGGEYYPDLSGEPLFPASALEVAATYDEPIGNVAVSADGRIFFTVHPESRPEKNKLMEWRNGQAVPYPDADFQQRYLITPLGVAIDRQDRLWVIDHGMHGFKTARLLAIDLRTDQLAHRHDFSSRIAQAGSFLQDLQVDSAGKTVYIADVSFFRKNPAIVVYDVETQTARRVLESHPSVYPQDWIIRTPQKEMTFFWGLAALKPGIDGIAIDKQDEWIYYGAMAHDSMYRVRTGDLKNASLSPDALAAKVELFAKKPLNDGLSMDVAGNLYIADMEHGAVVMLDRNRQLKTLIKDPRIRWADALSFGPESWLYLADSAIPDQMLRSKSHIAAAGPYYIFRFKPGNVGIPGQ